MTFTRGFSFAIALLILTAAAVPAAAETIAYWRFDNDGASAGATLADPTKALDETANDNDGTGVDGPTYSSNVFGTTIPTTGAPNALSLDFERDNKQYVEVAHDASLSFGNSSFTIEAWVKKETVGARDYAGRNFVVMKKNPAADTQMEYSLVAGIGDYAANFGKTTDLSGHEIGLMLGKGTGFAVIASNLQISDNDWHFLSAAFDADTNSVRFTLDSQLETISDMTFEPAANSQRLVIGAHQTAVGAIEGFDGQIDELRISGGVVATDDLLNPVPEPGAFALLLAAIPCGIVAYRRRRR